MFFGLSKVLQIFFNSFRTLSSVSVKYCSIRKENIYRVCITKKPRGIWQHLTDFWIKQNNILRLFECLQPSESTSLLPEKQKRSHCSVMHAFEEKTFLPYLFSHYLGESERNFVWYLNLILFINVIITD